MTAAKLFRLLKIGDLHWGAVPPHRLASELDNLFAWLEENEVDAVTQLGDYYDKRLSLDSDDSKASIAFAVRMAQFCQRRGIPFRIVKGGIAHDAHQLENLRPLESEYPCFRIIGTACHEELLPGLDVLWLPEEYPTSYSDYYGRFLLDEEGNGLVYDAIFGHGEIDVAAGWSAVNEGERHYGGTPCHAAELLLQHASGPIWFGHIHNRFRHKKRLGYPGSFTRWCHGEEDPKGIDVLIMKPKKAGGWDLKVETVFNEVAPTYHTVLADEILGAADAPDTIVEKIRATAEGHAKLRVKMTNYPIGIEELSLVRGALASDRRFEIVSPARPVIEDTSVLEEGATEEEVREAAEERSSRMSYLRDPSLPGEERLLRYLQESQPENSGITVEEVRELTAPLVG